MAIESFYEKFISFKAIYCIVLIQNNGFIHLVCFTNELGIMLLSLVSNLFELFNLDQQTLRESFKFLCDLSERIALVIKVSRKDVVI